jgi:hypothetical protein
VVRKNTSFLATPSRLDRHFPIFGPVFGRPIKGTISDFDDDAGCALFLAQPLTGHHCHKFDPFPSRL